MAANNDSALAVAEALPSVLVAAGGTGGHLFPAEALAAALAKRNVAVALATDARAARHAGAFAAAGVHVIPSATIRGRNPFSLAKTGTLLGLGTLKAWLALPKIKPLVVVGFGGYPSIPPLLAAVARGASSRFARPITAFCSWITVGMPRATAARSGGMLG